MKSDDNKKLIFDTSVITELLNLGLLEELANYRGRANVEIMVPVTVQDELKRKGVDRKIRDAFNMSIEKRLFKLTNPPKKTIEELKFRYPGLGDGEIGVLAVALTLKEHSSWSVIPTLDDAQARKVAKKLGLRVHGTLWLLVELKKNCVIEKKMAIETINELPDHGFFITDEKLREVIEEVKRDC